MSDERARMRELLAGLLDGPPDPVPWDAVAARVRRRRWMRAALFAGLATLIVAALVAVVIAINGGDSSPSPTPPTSTTQGSSTSGVTTTTATEPTVGSTIPPAATYCVIGTASDDVLNVRSGPGVGFDKIGGLAFDATGVRTTGRTAPDDRDREWYEIVFGGGTGWVASWFLAQEPCVATATTLVTTPVDCVLMGRIVLFAERRMTVLVGGEPIAATDDLPLVAEITLGAGSELTVSVSGDGGLPGLIGHLALDTQVVVTDGAWEVSAVGVAGPWSGAAVVAAYGAPPWPVPEGIAPEASWIWSASDEPGTIWFRWAVPPCG